MAYAILGDLGAVGGASISSGNASVDRLLAQADATIAQLIVPLHPAIDALAIPADQKQLLKTAPVTFHMQAFQSIENVAAEIIYEANRLSGRPARRIGVPGLNATVVNMAVDLAVDQRIPTKAGRHFIRLLRITLAYMILVYQDPGHLSVAAAKVLTKYGVQGAQIVAGFVSRAGQSAQRAAAVQLTAMQQAASRGATAAQALAAGAAQGAQTLISSLPAPPRLFGFGDLGIAPAVAPAGVAGGAVAAETTATTATAATTGVVATPSIAATVQAAALGLAGTAATGAAAGVLTGAGAAVADLMDPPGGEPVASPDGTMTPGAKPDLGKYVIPGLLLGSAVVAAIVLRRAPRR